MNRAKILFLIQVRMSSSRLPGKALLPIAGKPMIERLIHRLKPVLSMGELVIATTQRESEAPLVAFAKKQNIHCFRGEENDAVSRFLGAAEKFQGELLVRITADNPLTDPCFMKDLLSLLSEKNLDYAATKGLPLGTGPEVFTLNALKRVAKATKEPIHRESITSFMYTNPRSFNVGYIDLTQDDIMGRPSYRLTVDTEEDLEFIRQLFSALGTNPTLREIISLLDSRPDLRQINSHVIQRTL